MLEKKNENEKEKVKELLKGQKSVVNVSDQYRDKFTIMTNLKTILPTNNF